MNKLNNQAQSSLDQYSKSSPELNFFYKALGAVSWTRTPQHQTLNAIAVTSSAGILPLKF